MFVASTERRGGNIGIEIKVFDKKTTVYTSIEE